MKKKIIFGVMIFIIILGISISYVNAFTIDSDEDKFILTKGSKIRGSFIVEDYIGEINVNSDFDWLSFVPGEKVTYVDDIKGQKIIEGVRSIPYYIDVPKDADIGVYRTVIEIENDDKFKYLNVRIDVQNSFFATVFEVFEKRNRLYLLFVMVISFLFLLFIYLYVRFSK